MVARWEAMRNPADDDLARLVVDLVLEASYRGTAWPAGRAAAGPRTDPEEPMLGGIGANARARTRPAASPTRRSTCRAQLLAGTMSGIRAGRLWPVTRSGQGRAPCCAASATACTRQRYSTRWQQISSCHGDEPNDSTRTRGVDPQRGPSARRIPHDTPRSEAAHLEPLRRWRFGVETPGCRQPGRRFPVRPGPLASGCGRSGWRASPSPAC